MLAGVLDEFTRINFGMLIAKLLQVCALCTDERSSQTVLHEVIKTVL